MSSPSSAVDVAAVVIESVRAGAVRVAVEGTSYHLDLTCAASDGLTIGRVAHGIVHGTALRLHRARAGGVFIEPVDGTPRIVQGRVLATDTHTDRILLNAVVPIWLTVPADQAASDFSSGELINFYLASGASFQKA